MGSRFATVSKDTILAVMKQLTQQIPRERQNLACRAVYRSVEKTFSLNLQQNHKKQSPKDWQLKREKTLTKRHLLSTKNSCFDFYPTDLVNTKTTIPLRVGSQRQIYTSTLRVSVYLYHYSPPLREIVVCYRFGRTQLPSNKAACKQIHHKPGRVVLAAV